MKILRYRLKGAHSHPRIRVAIDVDNTFLRNDPVWRERFRQRCVAALPHRPIAHDEVSLRYDYFRHICRDCFEECMHSPHIILAHEPMPGSVEAVADLHGQGVEFHVITARPQSNVSPTMRWISKHGLDRHIATITFAESKRPICEELGAHFLIDDAPSVFEEMMLPVPSTTKLLVFAGTHNTEIEYEHKVAHWNEVHAILQSELAKAA